MKRIQTCLAGLLLFCGLSLAAFAQGAAGGEWDKLTGAVDVINRVDPRTAALLARNRDMRLSRTQGMGNRFAFVAQTDKDIYNNKDLMLALRHGIDRQKIVDNVFSGYAVLGNDHLVGPRVKFHDDKQPQTPFDPDKARFHYRKSGLNAPAIELQVTPPPTITSFMRRVYSAVGVHATPAQCSRTTCCSIAQVQLASRRAGQHQSASIMETCPHRWSCSVRRVRRTSPSRRCGNRPWRSGRTA